MATNFPGSIDSSTSLPYPTALSPRNSPSLAGLSDNQNDAIIATQTKVGTGASTPTSGNLLVGTGVGTSAWTKASPSGAIVGTTDIQTLTNKTLTSPTINAPTITNANITADTISGFSSANTGSIYGMSVAAGVLASAAILNTVNSAAIQTAAVTSSKLSLDFAESTLGAGGFTSAAANTWQDTGLNITLPTAGTWLVMCDLRGETPATVATFAAARLFNTTAGSAVTNTERIVLLTPSAAAAQLTTPITMRVVSVAVNTVIRVDLQPGGAYVCKLQSDANGRSHMMAVRIG